jgi:hypothetical protein
MSNNPIRSFCFHFYPPFPCRSVSR